MATKPRDDGTGRGGAAADSIDEGTPPLPAGTVLGSYTVDNPVEGGRGGMGRVYRAHHTTLGNTVAVKVLDPSLGRTPANRFHDRFLEEARTMANIKHDHIVRVMDFGEAVIEGVHHLFLVMDYLEGYTLGAALTVATSEQGLFPIVRALRVCAQIAEAVGYVHDEHIIHRDLKPENIFLTAGRDGHDHAVLLDFGIARRIIEGLEGESRLTGVGVTLGTPEYLSPEQAIGGTLDAMTDVYSLGLVLYEVLTRSLPHRDSAFTTAGQIRLRRANPGLVPKRVTEVRPDAPKAVADLLERMLAYEPVDRPTMAECAAVLGEQASEVAATSGTPAAAPRRRTGAVLAPAALAPTVAADAVSVPSAPKRHIPWAAVAVGAVALGLVVGLVLIIDQDRSSPRAPEETSAVPTPPPAPAPVAVPAAPRAAARVRNEPSPPRQEAPPRDSKGRREKERDESRAHAKGAFERARALGTAQPPAEPAPAVQPGPTGPVKPPPAPAPAAAAAAPEPAPPEPAAEPAPAPPPEAMVEEGAAQQEPQEPAADPRRKRSRAGRPEPDEGKKFFEAANADLQAGKCREALEGYQKVLRILRGQPGDTRYLLAQRKSLEARQCVAGRPSSR